MASTGFPQRGFAALLLTLLTGVLGAPYLSATPLQTPATPPQTQTVTPGAPASVDPGPIFRVYLTDGHALASYGECAILTDRVVFTLVIGNGGLSTQYQLISLPISAVDIDRTARYRDAVRAARYAATRGEADYADMTAEVNRSLDELAKIQDPKAKLEAAEEAKRRLMAWSEHNYHYRAKDIQELAGLFDGVITQLRVAAGEARVSLDLVAGAPVEKVEPIAPPPNLRESIELALAAAAASDVSTDRAAILNAAASVSGELGPADALPAAVAGKIAEEQEADRLFAALRADALAQADIALAKGDVGMVNAIRADVASRASSLPAGRRQDVRGLMAELDAIAETTLDRRTALDRYAAMRPKLLAYERALRPALSSLDSMTAVMNAIHDMKGPEVAKLEKASNVLAKLGPKLAALDPPEGLVDVHATVVSAVHLAQEACRRRILALAANNDIRLSGEAAASAAGATMLAEQARQNLIARLYPPKVR